MAEATAIADKDLPDIKPADKKLDTSKVDALKPVELIAKSKGRGMHVVGNDRLLELMKEYPESVAQLQDQYENRSVKEDGTDYLKQIENLKEKYGLICKEIESRKKLAVDVKPIEEEPIEKVR